MKTPAFFLIFLLASSLFMPMFFSGIRIGLPRQTIDIGVALNSFSIEGLPRAIPSTRERLFFFFPLRDLDRDFDP